MNSTEELNNLCVNEQKVYNNTLPSSDETLINLIPYDRNKEIHTHESPLSLANEENETKGLHLIGSSQAKDQILEKLNSRNTEQREKNHSIHLTEEYATIIEDVSSSNPEDRNTKVLTVLNSADMNNILTSSKLESSSRNFRLHKQPKDNSVLAETTSNPMKKCETKRNSETPPLLNIVKHKRQIKNNARPKKAVIDLEICKKSLHLKQKKNKINTYCNKKSALNKNDKEIQCTTLPTNDDNSDNQRLYQKIIVLNNEEKVGNKNNQLSVYDFYDEEDEKRKLEKQMKEEEIKAVKERTCQICKEVFDDPIDVLRHKREAHKSRKIVLSKEEIQPYLSLENRMDCPLCFKRICSNGYKSLYIKHIMTHCDNYCFTCKICGMKFKRKDHLQSHQDRHIVPPKNV